PQRDIRGADHADPLRGPRRSGHCKGFGDVVVQRAVVCEKATRLLKMIGNVRKSHGEVESPYAWLRLSVSLALSTIGGVGMWSVVVALPAVQAEFGVARGDASLPYTLTMIGFGLASVVMGRLADRFGIMFPVIVGTIALALGFGAAAAAGSLWLYALAQGLIGAGSAATFAPLLAHISLWFVRRRGIAVAIFAS